MTQCDDILHHLKTIGPLTPLDALNLYGCFRLTSRIYDLKCAGHVIHKEMVVRGEKSYAQYSYIGTEQQKEKDLFNV